MNDNSKQLTIEDFENKYTVIPNHIRPNDNNEFETYGPEVKFVFQIAKETPKRVWTVTDNNDGWYGIVAGYHIVNRIAYMITEEEWTDEYEEYVICDEGPVNDWFNSLAPSKMAEIMSIDQSLSLEEKEDKAKDAWYDLSIDEREEIMNKYKTDL